MDPAPGWQASYTLAMHQHDMLATAARVHRAAAASATPRPISKARYAIGAALIWLGARLYHYGLAYARSLDFMSVATHEMHDLCRRP